MKAIDPGFEVEDRVAVQLTVPGTSYPSANDVQRFYAEVLREIEAIPGVRSLGGTGTLPLSGKQITIPAPIPEFTRDPYPEIVNPVRTTWDVVTPGYFKTIGIPFLEGADFDPTELATDTTEVAIVNKAFVDRWFEGRSPIGERLVFGTLTKSYMRVVGVVGSTHRGRLADAEPIAIFQPSDQITFSWPTMELIVWSERPTTELAAQIREAVWKVDADQPITRIRSLSTVVQESMAEDAFQALLTGTFATVALLLGLVGIYGLVAYGTRLRRTEIGVRIALGASASAIRGSILKTTFWTVGTGVGLGLLSGVGIGKLLEGRLVDVSIGNPWLLSLAGGTVLAAGLVAAYMPAREAADASPMSVLRDG